MKNKIHEEIDKTLLHDQIVEWQKELKVYNPSNEEDIQLIIEEDAGGKPKRGRKPKHPKTQEEIDNDITDPNSKNYIDKTVLHNQIVNWQKELKVYKLNNESIIKKLKEENKKKDVRSRLDDVTLLNKAVAEKIIDKEPPMPNIIGSAILNICDGLSQRHNFRNYTWREDMVADAVVDCVKAIKKYNGDKFNNPFGFLSRIAYFAFVNRIKKEKSTHEAMLKVMFDPNTETFSQMGGDDFDISTDELRNFYYENK